MFTRESSSDIAWVPALVCATLCVFFMRSGLLAFFFLAPLGFMAYGYNPVSAWLCALAAILGNGFCLAFFSLQIAAMFPWWDCIYFTVLAILFTAMASPMAHWARIREAYRFVIVSGLGAVLFLLFMNIEASGFHEVISIQAELLRELTLTQAGTDVVQLSMLEQYLTPETLISLLDFVGLRGGALVSCFLIFLVSRQLSLVFTRFIRHKARGNLIHFHVDSQLIWVLSVSLLAALAGSFFTFIPLEITGWNLLVACALLYLAQGAGIFFHFFMTLRALPLFLRIAAYVLIVFLILSPGLNMLVLAALLLLGIAENWVPFRALNLSGPSSTPEK